MGNAAAESWKQFLRSSIYSNSHLNHSSYFQIATVAYNGRPSNRTVVFRGFQDDTYKIQINTDTRTRKIDDLKHCSYAEQREKSWFACSLRSRLQYLAHAPGLLSQSEQQSIEAPTLDPSMGPIDAFLPACSES